MASLGLQTIERGDRGLAASGELLGAKASDACVPSSRSLSSTSSMDTTSKSSLSSSITGSISSSDSKASEGKARKASELQAGQCGESRTSSSSSSEVSDSNESICSSFGIAVNKPHKANDARWEAIQAVRSREGSIGLNHFRLLKRLGCGDIGSVYLSELRGRNCHFAMKVMDKSSLASRKKLLRAQTEKEILQCLDHPFLPTLYTHFETDKFSCLVMEFCPGGDLHTLRQRQPGKHFSEMVARFYVAEVLLALEYLHMMGVVYRDLKPENVLVREDGHIMLSDFDLSLRCAVRPTLVKSASAVDIDSSGRRIPSYCVQPACEPSSSSSACIVSPACISAPPSCITPPSCLIPRLLPSFKLKSKPPKSPSLLLPELLAEPTQARSMSFVGTHEYLAPEIIKGDGHGSAVDWWTFGIFLYELLLSRTPFKGAGNRATLFNVVGQPLKFPDNPAVSFAARDLVSGLLVKDPQHRLGFTRGATEIKQHAFFDGINWALIRSMAPPDVPKPFELDVSATPGCPPAVLEKKQGEPDSKSSGSYLDFDFF